MLLWVDDNVNLFLRNWNERRKFEKQERQQYLRKQLEKSQEEQQETAETNEVQNKEGENQEGNQKKENNQNINPKSRYPTLPNTAKLIKIPVIETEGSHEKKHKKVRSKEWVLNTKGKSPVCILHEYLQHVLKVKPDYTFEEVDSSTTPYRYFQSILIWYR